MDLGANPPVIEVAGWFWGGIARTPGAPSLQAEVVVPGLEPYTALPFERRGRLGGTVRGVMLAVPYVGIGFGNAGVHFLMACCIQFPGCCEIIDHRGML